MWSAGYRPDIYPAPGEENLYLLYNQRQEEWYLQNKKKEAEWLQQKGKEAEPEPILIILEKGVRIYNRCMLVRKNETGELDDLQTDDLEKVGRYLNKVKISL